MLCTFRLKLFSAQGFPHLDEIFLFSSLQRAILASICPAAYWYHANFMHNALQQAVPQVLHPPCGETPSLVCSEPGPYAHDGPNSWFWQRKWAVNLHITHNYTKLYQTLPKFLFQSEKVQPMQLLFLQKPFKKERDHPHCPSLALFKS